MKIIICVTYLTGGGAERLAALWASGFSSMGCSVVVVLNTDSTVTSYSLPDSVRVYNIFKKENRLIEDLGLGQALRLRSVLKEEKPDIIIGVLPSWCKVIWMAKIGLGIPFIDTEHNSFERPKDAPMHWREWIDKFIYSRLADHMTVLTFADYKIISRKRKNVSVLPNPLPFLPVKAVPPKEKIILACGRLDAWYYKGFDMLIRSWGRLSKKAKGWKLVIAGDGNKNSYDTLNKIAKDSCLTEDSFELLGRIDDMQSLYKKSSIFVLSSRYEGFGMVLTEAMSQGCACIACDYKGRQQEIVGAQDYGIIVQAGLEGEIYQSLANLIGNECLRKNLQKNAITRSQEFLLDKIMLKWDEIVNNVIKY